MSKPRPILFEDALKAAVEKTKEHSSILRKECVLVRDLRGRISVLLKGEEKDYPVADVELLEKFKVEFSAALGAYGHPPKSSVLFAGDLFQGEKATYDNPDKIQVPDTPEGTTIWLLDRQIIGQDWMRNPFERKTANPRVVFYGIKGGVGRSTALIIWAWQLAKQGKRVLLFDFDLESPGLSSTILHPDSLPDFGIVDWFVEDGVSQAEKIENLMIGSSPLAKNLSGEILVVPSFGRDTGDYLPKLARCYADFSGSGMISWGERVQRLVEKFEQLQTPDVVLLDSRAGLHDIAAVLATRMGADTFLFAIDSPQTWTAYSFLFEHWKKHPAIRNFREKLQIVACLTPEKGYNEYLKRCRENSWEIFRKLYDDAPPGNEDAFNFDISDEDAPHYAWPIFWNRALQEFDPVNSEMGIDEKIASIVMDIFASKAENRIFPSGDME